MSESGATAPGDGGGDSPRPISAKLFLGGLSWDTTEEKLRDCFSKYGSIVEAVVMRDRQTGRPRGFGFVTFTEPAAADAVVEDVHVIDGRQIDAKKSVPQEMKPKARKVFVGGLSPDTTEDQFREYFGQFGEVVEAQIMQDHMSGRSRGFGFVTFAEDASAESVFAAGTMHDLGGKKVEVKPATPKGSGSLSRPSGSSGGGSSSSVRPSAGGGGGGGVGGSGRQMPPFVGAGPPLFGGQPSPAPYAAAGYGMYGFPPPGMMGPGSYGGMGMPYGGLGGMSGGGMASGGMASPYMVMGQMGQMGQMGAYPGGGPAYGYPAGGSMAPFSPSAAATQASPFAQQQQGAAQQQQHHHSQQQQQYPRPLRMMSRNGSRGTGKVDSASSLEHSAGVAASGSQHHHPHHPQHPHQQQQLPQQQQQQQHVSSVQEQMAKVSLSG